MVNQRGRCVIIRINGRRIRSVHEQTKLPMHAIQIFVKLLAIEDRIADVLADAQQVLRGREILIRVLFDIINSPFRKERPRVRDNIQQMRWQAALHLLRDTILAERGQPSEDVAPDKLIPFARSFPGRDQIR